MVSSRLSLPVSQFVRSVSRTEVRLRRWSMGKMAVSVVVFWSANQSFVISSSLSKTPSTVSGFSDNANTRPGIA
jgi:hypothetical protein